MQQLRRNQVGHVVVHRAANAHYPLRDAHVQVQGLWRCSSCAAIRLAMPVIRGAAHAHLALRSLQMQHRAQLLR